MGSTSSKPSTAIPVGSASSYEKQSYSHSYSTSTSSHHASDRLARIQAEQSHRQSTPRKLSQNKDASATVSLDAIDRWDDKALSNPTSRLAALTLHNADISSSLHRRTAEVSGQHVFNLRAELEGNPVTNQKSSGRCWLFATTNIIRQEVMKQLDVKEFQLSQSYLFAYDKIEKSNYFLENCIELADEALDSRVLGFLKSEPINDGGQWDMVRNLLNKYGVVPQVVYPESYNSSNTTKLNWLLTTKLREYCLELRELKKQTLKNLEEASIYMNAESKQQAVLNTLRSRKEEQMEEVYRIVVICLGTMPKANEEFTWTYYDSKKVCHTLKTTPLKFMSDYTGKFTSNGACSLVHDPRNSPNKLISVSRLGNVWGGDPVLYVNTSIDEMNKGIINHLKKGFPVFFGCDVGAYSDTRSGIMDTNLFDYESAFGITLNLTKAQRLSLDQSQMTHAMVITGAHVDETTGKIIRYRVENSWGTENVGDKGYMTMSSEWFSEYVYQVVIRKELMPTELWKLYENGVDGDTIILPPYDPFGALA